VSLGNGWGCEELAKIHERRGELSLALPRHLAACELDEPRACVNAGAAYVDEFAERGYGVARDMERGRKLFQRACDRGVEAGCQRLAALAEMHN
jgi:TPR repeat protein